MASKEIQEHFILRLPTQEAQYIRSLIRVKPKRLKKRLKLMLDPETKHAFVFIDNREVAGTLKTFPTIIECHTTHDKKHFTKLADICNIIDCVDMEKRDNFHGLTPPMKNVRRQRFRKRLINKNESFHDVYKELCFLFQADSGAVNSCFEVLHQADNRTTTVHDLFGEMSSDSEKTEDGRIGMIAEDDEVDQTVEDVAESDFTTFQI